MYLLLKYEVRNIMTYKNRKRFFFFLIKNVIMIYIEKYEKSPQFQNLVENL